MPPELLYGILTSQIWSAYKHKIVILVQNMDLYTL